MSDNTLSNFTPPGERGSVEDTRLIERAVRERWPIPERFRAPVANRQISIAMNPALSAREHTAAARCLVSMDKPNMIKEGLITEAPQINVTNIQNALINVPTDQRRTRLDALFARIGADGADPGAQAQPAPDAVAAAGEPPEPEGTGGGEPA